MNRNIKLSIAVALSFAGLYFAFAGEDIEKLKENIASVNIYQIYIAVSLLIFSCLPRALRWRLLIEPFESMPLSHVFSATMIGYLGNGVLVFRLGELLKAYVIAKDRQITTSQAFGTVIVERILDLLMVVLIFIITIPWFPFADEKIKFGIYLSITATFVIIILIFFTSRLNLLEKIAQFKMLSTVHGKKIIRTLNNLLEGVIIVLKNRNIASIIFLSLFIWFLYFLVGICVLKACDISLNYVDIGILLVISSLILGIPSLPGAAGTLDVGVKYTLVLIFQIETTKALSYSIISHAVSYFPFLKICVVYLLISNVNIKEIKDRVKVDEKI